MRRFASFCFAIMVVALAAVYLPFIFYKNMEIWGLLPLELAGRKFDKKSIKAGRRVMELKSREITGNSPQTPVWPLLESNPGQARLVFPDDRFHMTPSAMKFGGSGKAGIAGLVL